MNDEDFNDLFPTSGEAASAEPPHAESPSPPSSEGSGDGRPPATSDALPESPPQESQQESKTVPLAALQEERQKRRELEERIKAEAERHARLEQRLDTLFAQRDQVRVDEPKPPSHPDLDEDPVANLDFRLKQQETAAQQARQAQEQQAQLQQFTNEFNRREMQFANETPDYMPAVQWLRKQRQSELELMGYNAAYAAQLVDGEAMAYAIQMTQNGVDPVKAFYQTAYQRGYRPPDSSPTPGANGPAAPGVNGLAAPGAPQVNLAQLQQNMDRAQSAGGGATPAPQTTLADLAEMTDEEFEKATSGGRWARLWGQR